MRPIIPDPSTLTRPGDFLRVGVAFALFAASVIGMILIASAPLVDWGF